MQPHAQGPVGPISSGKAVSHREAGYQKVLDGRKQPVRGLWKRNDRFYARLAVENPETGRKEIRRVALLDKETNQPVRTVAEAIKAMERLKVNRADQDLPILTRTPKFSSYITRYLDHLDTMGDKRPTTVAKIKASLNGWARSLGDTRLDKIHRRHVVRHAEKVAEAGSGPRTVNLHVIALRGLMRLAMDEGFVKDLPTRGWRPLKVTQKKRELTTAADIDAICAAAFQPAYTNSRLAKPGESGRPLKNAQQFSDYVRLMTLCGSRRDETLRLKWRDVSFDHNQLTVGADGLSKNGEPRTVDFSSELEAHLKDMHSRRQPDSAWLFPSPRRGDHDVPSKTLRESVYLARQVAAKDRPHLAKFGFHDCRHRFISVCVMAGTDFLTIASWVGHKDGGVLIGKVYGHLSGDHKRLMAARLTFTPRLAEAAAKQAG